MISDQVFSATFFSVFLFLCGLSPLIFPLSFVESYVLSPSRSPLTSSTTSLLSSSRTTVTTTPIKIESRSRGENRNLNLTRQKYREGISHDFQDIPNKYLEEIEETKAQYMLENMQRWKVPVSDKFSSAKTLEVTGVFFPKQRKSLRLERQNQKQQKQQKQQGVGEQGEMIRSQIESFINNLSLVETFSSLSSSSM